jgi:uncharacterized protein (DUF433 family)
MPLNEADTRAHLIDPRLNTADPNDRPGKRSTPVEPARHQKREMKSNLLARITTDPAILVGKPVIRDMRISVAQIVAAVAAGVPQSELLEDYPGLEPDDIQAALLYAANLVEEERCIRC